MIGPSQSRTGDGLQAEVLGGLRLTIDGTEVQLRGAQRRRLVALLLANVRTPVSASRIVDALRAGQAAGVDDPANLVHAHITRLRRLLDPTATGRAAGWIRSLNGGYLFDPDGFDVDRFLALTERVARLSESEPTRAIEAAELALASWAAPWGDLGGDPVVQVSEASLLGRHRLLEESWASLVLESGQGGRHADTLVGMADADPVREVRWANAMRGLAQAGRQSEALDLYVRARRLLVGELGVEPGPGLRAVHDAVLRQDNAVVGPARRRLNAVVPRPLDPTVGREEEMALLDEASGRSRLISVVGLGGVGKSRLVQEWVFRAGRFPTTLWADLRDCAVVEARVSADLGLSPTTEDRDHLLHLIAAGLPQLPCVLVLDNAESCAEDVGHFASRLLTVVPHLGILVTGRVPLGLTGEHVLRLGPLAMAEGLTSTDSATELAAARLGVPTDDPRALDIAQRSAGLPLAIEVLAAQLAQGGSLATRHRDDDREDDREGDRVDPLTQAVDEARLHVSDDARLLFGRLLHLPGGVGVGLADALVGDLVDTSRAQATSADATRARSAVRGRLLRELTSASLLVTTPGTGSVRHRALAPISDQRVRWAQLDDESRVHHRLTQWVLGQVRHSFFEVPDRSGIAAVAAERLNLDVLLPWLAERDPHTLLSVAVRLEDVWGAMGRRVEAHRWIEQALVASGAVGVDRLAALVALVNGRGLAHTASSGALIAEATSLLAQLSDCPDDLRAAVLAQRGAARGWTGDVVGMAADFQAARHLAEAADAAWFVATVEEFEGLASVLTGRPDDGVDQCARAADTFLALGDGDSAVIAMYFAAVTARMASLPRRERLVSRAVELAEDHGTTGSRALVAAEQAMLLLHHGHAGAIDGLRESIRLVEHGGNFHNAAVTRRDLGLLLLRRGHRDPARLELAGAAQRLLQSDPGAAAVAFAGLAALDGGPKGRAAALAWSLIDTHVGSPPSPRDRILLEEYAGPPRGGAPTAPAEVVAAAEDYLVGAFDPLAHSA